jgi:hypothetical protein
MSPEKELELAEAKSKAAREQLTATLVAIQTRLSPRVLLREAAEEVRDISVELLRAGVSQAKRNPGPVLGVAATLAAYFARDWFTTHAKRTAEPAPDEPEPPAHGRKSKEVIKADVKRPPRRKR